MLYQPVAHLLHSVPRRRWKHVCQLVNEKTLWNRVSVILYRRYCSCDLQFEIFVCSSWLATVIAYVILKVIFYAEVCTILHQFSNEEHCLLLNSYIWMVSEPRADWLSASSSLSRLERRGHEFEPGLTQYSLTVIIELMLYEFALLFCPWVPYTINGQWRQANWWEKIKRSPIPTALQTPLPLAKYYIL